MDGYLDYNTDKKKTRQAATNFAWIMLVIAGLFLFTMIRFAVTANDGSVYTGMPDSGAVFEISKLFVLPTVQGDAAFSDQGYRFGRLSDSVYVIQSYVNVTENGAIHQTKCNITLKYKGGSLTAKDDWEVLNFKEFY